MAEVNEVEQHGEKEQAKTPAAGQKPSLLSIFLNTSYILIILVLIFGISLGFITSSLQQPVSVPDSGADNEVVLSPQEIASKVSAFLEDNLLMPGFSLGLSDIQKKGDSIYELTFSISDGAQAQPVVVFATADGKNMVVGNLFDLDTPLPKPEPPPQDPQTPEVIACEDVAKGEAPVLDAYVVSYCPFGLQMQRILAGLVGTGLEENVVVRYIGAVVEGKVTAMHGEQEAVENHLQICIREEQPAKYWDYVSCFIKEGATDACLAEAEVDTVEIEACMSDAERGVAYAEIDFMMSELFGAIASPTIILDGVPIDEFAFAEGDESTADGRSAENLKNLLCCAFSVSPAACSSELSGERAATSFSTEATGTGAGSC